MLVLLSSCARALRGRLGLRITNTALIPCCPVPYTDFAYEHKWGGLPVVAAGRCRSSGDQGWKKTGSQRVSWLYTLLHVQVPLYMGSKKIKELVCIEWLAMSLFGIGLDCVV